MVTHDEALQRAQNAYARTKHHGYRGLDASPLEAAIREFCEAKGLVMVPKRLTDAMATEINLTGTFKADAMQVRYSAMLTVSPDPFGDAP